MAQQGREVIISREMFEQLLQQASAPRISQVDPFQEYGYGSLRTNQQITPMTGIDNKYLISPHNEHHTNTKELFQPFDSTTSAGHLDGFGTRRDEDSEDSQHNTLITKQMQYSGPLTDCFSQPASRTGIERPCTPPNQVSTNYFPLTPDTTPFSKSAQFQRRTMDHSPTKADPNLTIKASHAMQRGTSCQDNFAAMRRQDISAFPSPPNTAPRKLRHSVDFAAFPQPNFMNMSSLKMDVGPFNAADYSPVSNTNSSVMSSFQSSPEMGQLQMFPDIGAGVNDGVIASQMSRSSSTQSATDQSISSSPGKGMTLHDSPVPSEIDYGEFFEDTGISEHAVASFITREATDGKWGCLYPDCGKTCARKENIKSHVQTHLDDRNYRCRDCDKRFVRQHDLKRHANIHSRIRSYPCPCGKPFARRDALTRHRQRGMCIGAFEGTPKKIVKRGRPKKTRPDTEERSEKSAKTRQKVLEKSPGKYSSSISGSSAYPSPEQVFEDMEVASRNGTDLLPVAELMSRSSSSRISTSPELDGFLSSPMASNTVESGHDPEVLASDAALEPFAQGSDFMNQDFDLSTSISTEPSSKEYDVLFDDLIDPDFDMNKLNEFANAMLSPNSSEPTEGMWDDFDA